ASGLAIGIKQGAVDVSGASQLLAKAVDTGIKELDLFNSENINSYDSIVENAVDGSAKATKGVYAQSNKHEQKTTFGSILGASMVALGNTGLLGDRLSEPVKHLGAYYQGNIDVHKLQGRTAREAELAVMYRSMLDFALKNKTTKIPSNWEVGSGTVGNEISQIPGFKNLHYTLGGFNYGRNQEGGLQINDVYDWTHDTNLITEFNTPFGIATKLNNFLLKHPKLAQKMGLTYLDKYKGYGKIGKDNNTLFALSGNQQQKEFQLSDKVHSIIGGKPYIQSHTVSSEKLKQLQEKARTAFNSNVDYDAFTQHPEIKSYLEEFDQPANPLASLLSSVKKNFSNGSTLGNFLNIFKAAFSKTGSLKDIGINLITSFGQGF
ncbi:MAG: hypothetical protein ACKPE3_16310, partial [Sphaerospermopsis kisseleviana]